MRLSLCLITRNEQHNLPRALASFQGVCDEIVVADTDSTDQTTEIAQSFGAKVISFPWIDDFSAARNFCISHAQGQWIFWLDADEELLPDSHVVLNECLARSDVLGWHVLRQDLVKSDRTDLFTEMWQLRLFRRQANAQFIGRCHPDFSPPLDQLARQKRMSVLRSSIRMRHWGYVPEVKPAKLQRAARLLKLELADRPGQLYYEIEFGRTLLALGQRDEAMHVFQQSTQHVLRCRNDPRPPSVMVEALLECLLALPLDESRPMIDEKEVFALCRQWFPHSVPLLWAMSRHRFQAGDFEQASGYLKALIQLGRDDRYDKTISFDPRIIREDAVLNLAVCLIRMAELDDAEKLLRGLLSSPRRVEAEQNLHVISQLRLTI